MWHCRGYSHRDVALRLFRWAGQAHYKHHGHHPPRTQCPCRTKCPRPVPALAPSAHSRARIRMLTPEKPGTEFRVIVNYVPVGSDNSARDWNARGRDNPG
jgi:hypothetical protein